MWDEKFPSIFFNLFSCQGYDSAGAEPEYVEGPPPNTCQICPQGPQGFNGTKVKEIIDFVTFTIFLIFFSFLLCCGWWCCLFSILKNAGWTCKIFYFLKLFFIVLLYFFMFFFYFFTNQSNWQFISYLDDSGPKGNKCAKWKSLIRFHQFFFLFHSCQGERGERGVRGYDGRWEIIFLLVFEECFDEFSCWI